MVFSDIYPNFPSANKSIEDLNIPDECLKGLRRTGIEYIGDVLEVYQRNRNPSLMDGFFPRMSRKCRSIIYRQIISLEGCPKQDEIKNWLVKLDNLTD